MKILHFLPFFSPHAKGGTEIFLLNLARAQVEHGHQVQIICPNTSQEAAGDRIEEIPITYFPFPYGERDKRFLSGTSAHHTSVAFCQIVAGIDPDVIHLHGIYPHFLKYLEALLQESRRRLILTVHLVNIVCPNQTLVNWRSEYCEGKVEFRTCSTCISSAEGRSPGRREINALTIPLNAFLREMFGEGSRPTHTSTQRRVDSQLRVLEFLKENVRIDVLNPWFYKVFALNGFSTQRLSYFRNPILDAGHFLPQSSSGARRECVHFLFVGRLSAQKGVDLLIRTLEQLQQFKDRFAVSFVGKHTDPHVIRELHRLINAGFALTLVGEIENKDMPLYYRGSEYLLFPSSRGSGDMLPLVIQEALESDLPVVSSNIPPARALVKDGINGYLFKADDQDDFCVVLREIIEGRRSLRFRYDKESTVGASKYAYYNALYQAGPSRAGI